MGCEKWEIRNEGLECSLPISHMIFWYKQLNFVPRNGKWETNEDSRDWRFTLWGGYFSYENSRLILISHFSGPNSIFFFKCHKFWNGKWDVSIQNPHFQLLTSHLSHPTSNFLLLTFIHFIQFCRCLASITLIPFLIVCYDTSLYQLKSLYNTIE